MSNTKVARSFTRAIRGVGTNVSDCIGFYPGQKSKLLDRELLAGNVGQPRGIISCVVDCYVNGNLLGNYSTMQ